MEGRKDSFSSSPGSLTKTPSINTLITKTGGSKKELFQTIVSLDSLYFSEHQNYLNLRNKLLEMKSDFSTFRTKDEINCRGYLSKRKQLLDAKRKNSGNPQSTKKIFNPSKPKDAEENYAFAGMHHIFVEHTEAVVQIKFANEDKNLIAFSSLDGKISICNALYSPRLIRNLDGHTASITDFCWSMMNDLILSTSEDKTIRLWRVANGECIRNIPDEANPNCCCFYSHNNNIFFVGTSKGFLKTFNLSTGKCVAKNQFKGVSINTMEFDLISETLFLGDNTGNVHVLKYLVDSNKFLTITKVNVVNRPIHSLQYKAWHSVSQQSPSLLVNSIENNIKLFKVEHKPTFRLTLDKQFSIANVEKSVRSKFCPLISNFGGMCVVSGSEDFRVLIFDSSRSNHCINELQGHGGVVYDVAWNYNETLLASCDETGTVILWKRINRVAQDEF